MSHLFPPLHVRPMASDDSPDTGPVARAAARPLPINDFPSWTV